MGYPLLSVHEDLDLKYRASGKGLTVFIVEWQVKFYKWMTKVKIVHIGIPKIRAIYSCLVQENINISGRVNIKLAKIKLFLFYEWGISYSMAPGKCDLGIYFCILGIFQYT